MVRIIGVHATVEEQKPQPTKLGLQDVPEGIYRVMNHGWSAQNARGSRGTVGEIAETALTNRNASTSSRGRGALVIQQTARWEA